MQGKYIPIPTENIGTVVTALRVRIATLSEYRKDARNSEQLNECLTAEIAALTWAMDNCRECPEVEIGGGH